MASTWLPWCERSDGPLWKQGYGAAANRTLNDIKGDVKHSAEGSYSALLAEINNPNRTASWTFSMRKDGHTVQHYPLESITWHCGNMQGNIDYVGIEHAGKGSTGPLTVAQELATIRISKWLREHTAAGDQPPAERVNLWEHNWLSPSTSCPSGRVPWPTIIAALQEEEKPKMALMILRVIGRGLWLFDGATKKPITAAAWAVLENKYGMTLDDAVIITSDEVDDIPGQSVRV